MLILVVEPGKVPYTKEINGTLEEMQQIVGGYIQAIYPFPDEVALICNEEGTLAGLPLNRSLRNENGQIYEIIAGTFFVCGAPSGGDSFVGLPPERAELYKRWFCLPEVFLEVNGGTVSLPVEENDK